MQSQKITLTINDAIFYFQEGIKQLGVQGVHDIPTTPVALDKAMAYFKLAGYPEAQSGIHRVRSEVYFYGLLSHHLMQASKPLPPPLPSVSTVSASLYSRMPERSKEALPPLDQNKQIKSKIKKNIKMNFK